MEYLLSAGEAGSLDGLGVAVVGELTGFDQSLDLIYITYRPVHSVGLAAGVEKEDSNASGE